MMELKKGITLQNGKYTIEKKIGNGSFGITYLATMRVQVGGSLGSIESTVPVTIKEFFMSELNTRSEDGSLVEGSQNTLVANYRRKFRTEAHNLGQCKHHNIVKVLEVWDENNTTYYAMEYIDGISLDDYIHQHGPIPEQKAIEMFSQLANAVQYMHSKRMLHLDIKPKNAMVRKDGNLVLIDFGLSKQYDANGDPESNTRVGGGTPGYAPVEQADFHDGKGFPVTMDVYALGGTLFKMLTAQTPPVVSAIVSEGFPAAILERCNVSQTMIAVIKKAMALSKNNRYQTVAEMGNAIRGDDEDTTLDETKGSITTNEELKQDTEQEPTVTENKSVHGDANKKKKILRIVFIVLAVVLALLLTLLIKTKREQAVAESIFNKLNAEESIRKQPSNFGLKIIGNDENTDTIDILSLDYGVTDCADIKERNIMIVQIIDGSRIRLNGEDIDISDIGDRVKEFLHPLYVKSCDDYYPEKEGYGLSYASKGIIALFRDNNNLEDESLYEDVKSVLMQAFYEMRDDLSKDCFGKSFRDLTTEEQSRAIRKAIPLAIVEIEPNNTSIENNYGSETQRKQIGDLVYFDNGDKGIVFWVDGTGEHGLVVSMDEGHGLFWKDPSCISVSTDLRDTYESYSRIRPGKGITLTTKIINAFGIDAKAATWARSHGKDWYLPSNGEMFYMLRVANKHSGTHGPVSNGLAQNGGTTLSARRHNGYFTSSLSDSDGWIYAFDEDAIYCNTGSSSDMAYRAIRQF